MRKVLRDLNQKLLPEHIFLPPKWLVMGVNNVCNLHCKMCDVGTQSSETVFSENLVGTRPIDMPLELFETAVAQAAEHYPGIQLGYAFTEPLVYRYLEESLDLCRRYGIPASITTNGLKLPDKARAIAELGVRGVYLSLDGTQEVHNDIRGHRHSFQRAIEGLESLFQQRNPPRVSIFCVITEWNIGHLAEFVSYFQQFPIEHIGLMHTNFTTREVAELHNSVYGARYFATHSNIEQVSIERMNLDQLWKDICAVENLNTQCTVSFSPPLRTRAELDTFYNSPATFIGRRCRDVFSNIMIKSDGTVIPAHGRCYNVTVGNLYEQSLADIWNSTVFSTFRRDLTAAGGLLPACSRCCSAFS